MTVRKILGNITLPQGNHAIAKLDNGCYAVGDLRHGKTIVETEQFPDLDTAFAHWRKVMENNSTAST